METKLLLQIIGTLVSVVFIYWGVRTVFSRKYFMQQWNKNNPGNRKEKYEDFSSSDVAYSRYGWGWDWLLTGLALLALVIYSFFK